MFRLAVLLIVLLTGACGEPQYPLCKSNDHCQLHELCINGRCVQCTGDDACGPGQKCVDGACQADLDGCHENADCTGGQVCLFNLCSSCFEDDQCDAGTRCVDGVCLGCAGDQDCQTGEICQAGVCTEPPPPEQEPEVVGPGECTVGPVYFDWDSDQLTEDALASLDAMVPCLDDGMTHAIIGRADDSGDEYYNLDLGLRRAQAVKDHLVDEGIPADKLVISSAGEKFATDDAQKSRRVDIQ